MNSAAAALVSAAALAALLAVHSAAVGSEVRIAGEAADMIASLAALSNEAVSASYDAGSRSITVRNHGQSAVRLFLADIVVEQAASGADPVRVRIALAPDRYAAPPGLVVSNGTAAPLQPQAQAREFHQAPARGGAREVAPGAAASIPLAGALAAAAAAAAAADGGGGGGGGGGGLAVSVPRLAAAAVVTDAGNRFAVAVPPPPAAAPPLPRGGPAGPGGAGNGTGNGTAMINGMGIDSRILHAWHGGFAVEGNGTAGRMLPVAPYIATDGTADDFVGVVIAGEGSERLAVESLSGSYEYGPGGSLARGHEGRPAPLAYAAKRTLEGSPSVGRDPSGLHLRGPGRVVLELHGSGGPGGALFLSGSVRGGAELFVGVSPYDLISRAYAAGQGFEVWRGQAAAPSVLRLDASCSPPPGRNEFAASYEWDVPSVPVGARGRVSHAAEAAANNNLPDPATGARGAPLMPAAARVSYGSGGGLYSTVESLHMQSGSSPQLNGRTDCRMRPAGVLPVLYDEVPMAELLGAGGGRGGGGAFEAAIAAPGGGAVYALAHLDGSSAAVDLSARRLSPGEVLLRLGGLPPSVPYRLAAGGATVAAGVTSPSGGAALTAADLGVGGAAHTAVSHCAHECPAAAAAAHSAGRPAGTAAAPGAVLHLYEDSFAVRGHIDSAVAYDPLGGASFEVPHWRADTVYVVHAWARIPVVGRVDVSGTALNGTLPLPYLDGPRGGAGPRAGPEYLHVPVVPGYAYAAMSVNSVPAALAFADAAAAGGGAGGGAVRILPAARASAVSADPGGPVLSASASAGATTAHMAPRDGRLGAVFAVQVSGSARIDNVHAVAAGPPQRGGGGGAAPSVAAPEAPPGWSAGFLVSPHVVVRINGEGAGVVPLGAGRSAGAAGAGEYSSSAGAGSVLESVAYRPFVHDARGSASVPVRAGDLVEFEVRAAAEARAPPAYAPPAGMSIARSTGSAHVSVAVVSGSVIAGM